MNSEFRWLLDRAAQWGIYVRTILPESMDQVAQWNAPCPRWRSKQVFERLREIEQLGWIRFFEDGADGNEISVSRPAFDPRAIIDVWKKNRTGLSYRLTDEGAAEWERVANPRWNCRYCLELGEEEPEGDEERHCIVKANSEEVVRQSLLIAACMHNFLVVPGTERYAACGSWNATYWKRFESGVQAIAAVSSRDLEFHVESVLPLSSQRRLGESCQALHIWYERSEEPDWQFREYLEHGGMW